MSPNASRQAAPPTAITLWGDQLVDLGEIAFVGNDTGSAGLACTRGRFRKGYAYVDPNEDVGLLCSGLGGTLLAVADGHEGIDAARAAMQAVERRAPHLTARWLENPAAALDGLLSQVAESVRRSLPERGTSRHHSGTALSLALVTSRRVTGMTIGDTTVLRVRGSKAVEVTKATAFLTVRPAHLPAARSTDLRPGDKVVVASDGLTDFLGRRWKQVVAETLGEVDDPVAGARALVEAACRGGAGDNVTVAVHHVA